MRTLGILAFTSFFIAFFSFILLTYKKIFKKELKKCKIIFWTNLSLFIFLLFLTYVVSGICSCGGPTP